MRASPGDDPTAAPAVGISTEPEQVVVAGTEVHLDLTVRDGRGEVAITGAVTEADVDAVVGAVRAVLSRPELAAVTVHLAADHPVDQLDPLPEAVADAVGLPRRRDLLQLRRSLPVPVDHPLRSQGPTVAVRPIRLRSGGGSSLVNIRPGSVPDVAAWLRVNNRAFAAHPDQGAETVASFVVRLDVEWDDPSGFLVADDADRTGEFAGFCWTKTHEATSVDPALGEIYVIGVDPSHRGEGLGPPLVLAGLDHLASRGFTIANLYVDADNEPARRLYDRLGFSVHQRRRVYTAVP